MSKDSDARSGHQVSSRRSDGLRGPGPSLWLWAGFRQRRVCLSAVGVVPFCTDTFKAPEALASRADLSHSSTHLQPFSLQTRLYHNPKEGDSSSVLTE